MILLRFAFGVIMLATMYFNGVYGWSRGTDDIERIAFAASSVAIDMLKCGLLVRASVLWSQSNVTRAVTAFMFFVGCLAFSMNAGIAFNAVATDQHVGDATAQADTRDRAKAAYSQAADTLATLKRNPTWEASAACRKPTSKAATEFCARAAAVEADVTKYSAQLERLPIHGADPHAQRIAALLHWKLESVQMALGLSFPILFEMLASFGLFIVWQPTAAKTTEQSTRTRFGFRLPRFQLMPKTPPAASQTPLSSIPKQTQTARLVTPEWPTS